MLLYTFDSLEAGWKVQYERTRDHCIHGLSCKTGPSCKSKWKLYYSGVFLTSLLKRPRGSESTKWFNPSLKE